ncbi:MAG: ABC transporter permease [Rhodospirillaceae bacterium]
MERFQEIIIEPGRTEAHYWRDVWRYGDLFLFLAWRDVLVRYKQTLFGFAWAWLRPLLTMVAFTIVFGRLANLPSGGVPYPLLVFAGVLAWQFASTAFAAAAASLVDNANLVAKVYFPRILMPLAAVAVCLVDVVVAAVLLLPLMLWYGITPDLRILALPLFIALTFVIAVGPGLWIAALNVKYRDFRYVIPFLIQFGMYVSPVGFSTVIVPEQWRLLFALNPMVGAIEGFRWSLLGGNAPLDVPMLALSGAVAALLLYVGVVQFRKTEKSFADVI